MAGRGTVRAARGVFTSGIAAIRNSYFVATDVADRLPKPIFRPWYLGAALLVIAAAAGVPFARSQWFAAKAPVGTLRVESARPGVPVTIDGAPSGQAPLSATLGVGRHRIEVGGAGRTRVHDVEVMADRETVVEAGGTDLRETGTIHLVADPAGAEIWLDGALYGTSPLTMENVAAGPHNIIVRAPSGSVRQKVVVRANETVEANVQVRPGWLAVFAPVRLEVFKDGRAIGSTEGGRILAPPGEYTVELVGESVGCRESIRVEVKPGEVSAFTAKLPLGSLEIAAPSDTEISIDGEVVGKTPLEPVPVTVGTREVVMRHPTFGERRQVVTVVCGAGNRVAFQ